MVVWSPSWNAFACMEAVHGDTAGAFTSEALDVHGGTGAKAPCLSIWPRQAGYDGASLSVNNFVPKSTPRGLSLADFSWTRDLGIAGFHVIGAVPT